MNTVAELIELAQPSTPLTIAQLPLLLLKTTPLPDAAPVIVAQVPVVYHVPAEMMQPFVEPEVCTFM